MKQRTLTGSPSVSSVILGKHREAAALSPRPRIVITHHHVPLEDIDSPLTSENTACP